MVRQKVTGLQWIADVGWIADPNLQTPRYMPYLRGTLGIAVRRGEIPGFRDFLLDIHPENDLDSHGNIIVSLVKGDLSSEFELVWYLLELATS